MEGRAEVPQAPGMTDDFPILAAVAASPTHPYELLEHLQALGVRTSRSTLYRRVDGLIERGYLEAEDGRGESGRLRRLLRLTDSGRDAAGKEAAEVLRREPLESPLFALAVAAAGISQRHDALGVLRPRLAAAARRLTEEERSLREAATDPWSEAARERRIAHLQADISWLQGLLGRRLSGHQGERITRRAS
jgi:DNA-binding PadR family transcriptional regulator